MKKLIFSMVMLAALSACNSKSDNGNTALDTSAIEIADGENSKEPKFAFEETFWDFGTITEGERVEHTFKFKNVGNDDLIISSVTSTCGCTAPSWSRKPIKAGEEGKITVEFNSAGKKDLVNKTVTILANTVPVKSEINIKVFVEKE